MTISHHILLAIEIVLKLLISALCGGVLVYEQHKSIQPYYTQLLVMTSLGACLLVILWDINFGAAVGLSMMFFSSMIVFLGIISSAIILTQRGSMTGMAIATTIWVAAAIGMSVGYSLYLIAIITTLIAFFSLRLLSKKVGSL